MKGNWAALYMKKQFSASAPLASTAMAIFWGMVTAGRILFAAIEKWVPEKIVCQVFPLKLDLAKSGLYLPFGKLINPFDGHGGYKAKRGENIFILCVLCVLLRLKSPAGPTSVACSNAMVLALSVFIRSYPWLKTGHA